jgi:hypothetical protein
MTMDLNKKIDLIQDALADAIEFCKTQGDSHYTKQQKKYERLLNNLEDFQPERMGAK